MKDIILKYLSDNITDLELDQLLDWLKEPKNLKEFHAFIIENYNINTLYDDINEESALQKIKMEIQKRERLVRKSYWQYVAAAVFIGVLATGYLLKDNLFNASVKTTPKIVKTIIIPPGTDKAILTLEDGSVVALEKGNAYKAQNISSNGEKIVYDAAKRKSTEVVYNFLTIPRSGQFHLILSDGTEVWLNSESQLKYPVTFVEGETREVELIYGEAYFDVSPSTEHKGSKFKVFNSNQEVEVLGTEFNIKAYKDEDVIYTTLVEGKVAVSNSVAKQNLVPNQQSKVYLKNKDITIHKIDVFSETSWRKGLFSFKSKSLKEIMVVLSRWYDVEIIFENKDLESLKFKGTLDKQQSIEEILSIMKSNTISNYEIKNKIIILK